MWRRPLRWQQRKTSVADTSIYPRDFHFLLGPPRCRGYEVVNAVFRRPVPWRDGFAAMEKRFKAEGRPKQALCGVELRCPAPMTPDGFHEFNIGYRAILEDWDIIIDGVNPVGRTNVSPVRRAPSETLMYGFSYTVENADAPPTFHGAGGGETSDNGIIAEGDMSQDGMRKKAARVMEIMMERLSGLGMEWKDVTDVNVYTAAENGDWLATELLPHMGRMPHTVSVGISPVRRSSVSTSKWTCAATAGSSGSRPPI